MNFALDTEHDTGMYVSAENAISLGGTSFNWSSGRDKYKVIWDGIEYTCYSQATTHKNPDKILSFYDWQILGNGNNKLNCYNKDTTAYPFAITQDKWKNSAEWLVYATTSTAATHTIKVIKIEGTYDKVTPEYQYGYLSMLKNGRNNSTLIQGYSYDDVGMASGILSGDGNEYDSSSTPSANDLALYIFGIGNRITRKGAGSAMQGIFISGSGNSVDADGRVANTSINGYSNKIDNNSQKTLTGVLMGGQENTLSLDSSTNQTVYADLLCGAKNTISYNDKGTRTYGLNIVGGGFNTLGNAGANIVGGMNNTILSTGSVVYSIISGFKNTIGHSATIVGGQLNTTDCNFQVVSGKYSAANEKALVKVGNGTADDARANAFEVLDDNRAKVYGAPFEDTDVVRFLELKSKLDNSSDSFIGANGVTVTSENNKIKISADGCVQKYADSIGVTRLYGNTAAGVEHAYIVATSDQGTTPERISMYRASDSGITEPNGYLICHAPENDYQTTNKLYVDNISATYIDVDLIGA